METFNANDKLRMEIREGVKQMPVGEFDSEDVRNAVEQVLADYLKNDNIDMDASDLKGKLEWSVNVRLKK